MEFPSGEVVASIDLGEACYDVVTYGNFAICGGYNNNTVKIIDLSSLELVAEVPTGQRPMELTVHPYDNIVYAANIKSNTISVIELSGPGSQVIATIPCGIIGVYIPFFGIRSGVEVDPGGDYLLVAASFDDQVKVIDTETNQVVKSLDVGDFPLAIEFQTLGNIACVTNLFDHSFSLISLDGADSEVIGTWPANGDYPVDVAYYPDNDEFWLCNYNSGNITRFDASTGAYGGQVNMNAYGGVWKMDFYLNGDPIYLTVGNETYNPSIIFQDSIFQLPASPATMEWGFLWWGFGAYAVAPIPGPDYVSVIEIDWLEGVDDDPLLVKEAVAISPNPFTGGVLLKAECDIDWYSLFDLKGNLLKKGTPGENSCLVRTENIAPGTYLLRIGLQDGTTVSSKVIRSN
jgi:YVTN family beta-propeller protein